MLTDLYKWFNKKFGWFFTNGRKFQENPNMYEYERNDPK